MGLTHGATSPSTGPCYFLVDDVDPGEPVVTVGRLVAGVPGPVTFSPAPGDTDVVGYDYGFDNNVVEWVAADANGNATVWVTLTGDPDFPGTAVADLWVRAVDTAGNRPTNVTGPILLAAEETTP
ncbi:hypothetical protein ACI2K4_32885 [Micromonospora sp. NPDC050397]|uniref:hypothetical protein n=1 Tax=Micromonospora sp. NPDC050397 TaxID=3364279 RepID=UPI0038507DCC